MFRIYIKRLFSVCLVFALFLTSFPLASAATYDTEYVYNWLVSAGFPAEFLDIVDEEFLLKMYKDSVAADELEVTASVAYMGSDDSNSNSSRATIPSTELEFWVLAGKVSVNNVIEEVNMYVGYEWAEGLPLQRHVDSVGAAWDSTLWYYEPNTFDSSVSSNGVVRSRKTDLLENTAGGIGWEIWMPGVIYGSPSGNATFKLRPKNTALPNGTEMVTSVHATYFHLKKSTEFNLSFTGLTIPTVGISLTSGFDKRAVNDTITYGN